MSSRENIYNYWEHSKFQVHLLPRERELMISKKTFWKVTTWGAFTFLEIPHESTS